MRQQGYYWVRPKNQVWRIAYYYEQSGEWADTVGGVDFLKKDDAWAEISEQRITLPNYLERKDYVEATKSGDGNNRTGDCGSDDGSARSSDQQDVDGSREDPPRRKGEEREREHE